MSKIGVLTYLREYANLGTNMQAYCTLRALQSNFPNSKVELIDYAPWRPMPKPYFTGLSARSLRSDWVRISKYRSFFRNELVFSERRLVSSDVEESLRFIAELDYDAIYVGSDTVLELKHAHPDRLTAFWLSPRIRCPKVLIAASCHNVTHEAMSASRRRQVRSTIDDFSLLGVRDDATHRLLSHFVDASDSRLTIVPDPTFTYTIDYRHVDRYLADRGVAFDRPVVCLHLLRDTTWADELAARFRKAGYVVASLRPANYADLEFTDLSPFEQLGLYRYFTLMITHRFHDTVFCLKNGTPVIPFAEHTDDVTTFGESRIDTLLKSFGVRIPDGIRNGTRLSAESLFHVHRDLIAHFIERRPCIEATARESGAKYESFVRASQPWN